MDNIRPEDGKIRAVIWIIPFWLVAPGYFSSRVRVSSSGPTACLAGSKYGREYTTSAVKQRVHQRAFRERVLRAYREQCTLCRLKHVELLEAAHIIPDADPEGEPSVVNGLALCKLHHAAFDRNFLGIRPDYTVMLRDSLETFIR